MEENRFELIYTRFHGMNDQKIVFEGCFENETEEFRDSLRFYVDGKEIKPEIVEKEGAFVRQRLAALPFRVEREYFFIADLGSAINLSDKLEIINRLSSGKERVLATIKIKDFRKNSKKIFYSFDEIKMKDDKAIISGWAIAKEKLQIDVRNKSDNSPVRTEMKEIYREDVANIFPEIDDEYVQGFKVLCDKVKGKKLKVTFIDGKYTTTEIVSLNSKIVAVNKIGNLARKSYAFYKKYGVRNTVVKIKQKLFHTEDGVNYDKWIRERMPSKDVLEEQRRYPFEERPKISLVIPLYKTPGNFLRELIESVKNQTYDNWELCFSDGSGVETQLRAIIEEYAAQDKRIKATYSDGPLQISDNTNEAIKISTGDIIAFSDHDDLLTPDAFFEFVKVFEQFGEVDAVYSDEDKISMDGKKYFQPHFKPDFNKDLLNNNNYICHLFMVKRELLEEVGNLNPEYDGSQDYDFILRCSEKANKIYHIPKVLYHWRAHKDSTAENPESKLYAFDAGRRAVAAHHQRCGIEAEVTQPECYGIYRTQYKIKGNPVISIIIPNKDHVRDLQTCITSIVEKTNYENYEIIVVENNSEKEETFEFYKELENKYQNIRVVNWKEKGFNYSAINNFGARYASGEYLLFLNNDTEIINENCLEELLGYCQREDVGVVGARLYYPDETIQHAGVVIGLGGVAGHLFLGTPRGQIGYFAGIICAQDYSAVTAACMMTKKELFEKVGGFDEKLAIAFNDIDYCLKVRREGKLVVYNPYAELYHYESKSRKKEDTRAKANRLKKETEIFEKRWSDIYEKGDPYYNPNFTKDKFDCSINK